VHNFARALADQEHADESGERRQESQLPGSGKRRLAQNIAAYAYR
jgi:hypothetical protein